MKISVIAIVLLVVAPVTAQQTLNESERDSLTCERIFEEARSQRVGEQSLGGIVLWVGQQFIGSPYVAHTLDQEGEERLVVNLREFDCVTFVENAIVLAQCIKAQEWTFEDFKNRLQKIRYRDGMLDGYASRLHYFSEWISDNHRKGTVVHLTPTLGGELRSKPIDWMTQHRTAYHQLSDQKEFQRIADIESQRSKVPLHQIPRTALGKISQELMPGDVLAFVSTRSGLDVGHVAFALPLSDGSVHLLHASDRSKEVVLTDETLEQYFQYLPRSSGIMVARPMMRLK
jgi:hypothetical protein